LPRAFILVAGLKILRGLNCPADELATVVEPTLALVAATDDEVVDAVVGVELENVPRMGPPPISTMG
jgi:hypothetical protein